MVIDNTTKRPSECPQKSNESLSPIIFEINDIGEIRNNLDQKNVMVMID